jgi:hypothetical protein
MAWGARTALLGLTLALALAAGVLSGCTPEPKPEPTPKSVAQACADLKDAVGAYYDNASPGSTLTELETWKLPVLHDFTIPRPDCAFQIRPNPQVVAGDVFTIESFYLDYDETMTLTLGEQLTHAGYAVKDAKFHTWATTYLGKYYSAAMLLFPPGDSSEYGQAVEHFRLLDLSLGQN